MGCTHTVYSHSARGIIGDRRGHFVERPCSFWKEQTAWAKVAAPVSQGSPLGRHTMFN